MTTFYVFGLFTLVGLIFLTAAALFVLILGWTATLIIFGGALLFGGGAAIIEYTTTERTE